jgi:glycosyltransferase involved in cell wall biosynthesis
MPMICQVKELLRDIGIVFQRCNPLTRAVLASAERVYVATPFSLRLIPPKWHTKTKVQLSIAICEQADQQLDLHAPDFPRFVFAGRLVYWKGVHIAIRALAEVKKTIPTATLTLIGDGPDAPWLRNEAIKYGVIDAVEFAGQLSRQQLLRSLSSYTALVFPSLHDSGGFVVLEALQGGIPVVCLDLGGPGIMVNASCGIVVSTVGADEARVVTDIADAMISLGTMSATQSASLSAGAIARANELSWRNLTERITGC